MAKAEVVAAPADAQPLPELARDRKNRLARERRVAARAEKVEVPVETTRDRKNRLAREKRTVARSKAGSAAAASAP